MLYREIFLFANTGSLFNARVKKSGDNGGAGCAETAVCTALLFLIDEEANTTVPCHNDANERGKPPRQFTNTKETYSCSMKLVSANLAGIRYSLRDGMISINFRRNCNRRRRYWSARKVRSLQIRGEIIHGVHKGCGESWG